MAKTKRAPQFDVAVIGCGPVGATAANLLGQAGLKVLVAERAAAPHPLPRAVHLDHEMMRIFQSIGLGDRMRAMMRETHGHVHLGADGGVIRYLGAHGLPKRFGWANDYFFYQPELEATLRLGLGRFPNVDLRLGVTLAAMEQGPDAVRLTLDGAGGRTEVDVRYVIGCDGASSTVRGLAGIELDDLGFEEPWLVVDAEVDGPISFPDIDGLPEGADLQHLSVMVCDPRRPATIVPGRGDHRRWEFMLLPGETDAEMMRPDVVEGLVEPWVRGANSRIIRAATYRFHGLVALEWRKGRVFLAGDAAHQTPPFFGQGMCHGLRDVANLAWKLPLVLSGRADESLLDTYQPERDPHVRAVIGAAVEAGRYICELDPGRAAARDARLRAEARASRTRTAADLIPALAAGVVAAPELGRAGERFIQPKVVWRGEQVLLDEATGGGFVLIAARPQVLGGLSSESDALWRSLDGRSFALAADGLEDVEGHLADWLEARFAVAVLVRPDGYVYGVAGGSNDLDAMIGALANDLKLTPQGRAAAREDSRCSA